jgi:hypothetical protein
MFLGMFVMLVSLPARLGAQEDWNTNQHNVKEHLREPLLPTEKENIIFR